jgi:hypothetical protein
MNNESEVQFAECNQCGANDCNCEPVITYRLIDKNSPRFMRGKEHAKFMITEDGKELGFLWMSNNDIKENAKNNPTQKDVLFTGLIT